MGHPACISHLNLRHLAVECVEEKRQDVVVQVVFGGLFQNDGQPLEKGNRRLYKVSYNYNT